MEVDGDETGAGCIAGDSIEFVRSGARDGQPTTAASFATFGLYVLQLTASDGALSGTANVAITVNPQLKANAGANQRVEATGPDGARVTLNGSATGGNPDALTFTWNGPFGTLHGSNVNPVIPLGDGVPKRVEFAGTAGLVPGVGNRGDAPPRCGVGASGPLGGSDFGRPLDETIRDGLRRVGIDADPSV